MTVSAFQKIIWKYYNEHGRDFPWRRTTNPYRTLVSEVMLQQTQADRVVSIYNEFIKAFPTIKSLDKASLLDALTVWQGLGYNRRLKMLKETAGIIVREYKGKVPKSPETLMTLPGIGPYTARAICAFAYNTPSVFIETNIRSVYLHFFFKGKDNVADAELLSYIEKTLDRENPREWYGALMDYGAMLKKSGENPSRKSKHYTKQSAFKGSDREIRGSILKLLVNGAITEKAIQNELSRFKSARVSAQIEALKKEGMLKSLRGKLHVA